MADSSRAGGSDKVSVPSIKVGDTPAVGGDERAVGESRAMTVAALRNQKLAQQIKHIEAEHAARLRMLRKLFWLLAGWLAFVAGLILMQGGLLPPRVGAFRLAESEMLAVLGVTTVNVLGVFLVAARYLFPHDAKWQDRVHPDPRPRQSSRRPRG